MRAGSAAGAPVAAADRRLARALAELEGLVNWERRDRAARMRQGLDGVRDLLARLGHPERAWRAVHVGGTKGKGSVASLVGAGLAAAGRRVGVYASPHVERMHERIRVDGREASDALLAEGLEQALGARRTAGLEGAPAAEATWFDVVTAAAFWIFARERVDWAVVEVGLGGRLDSTNAIDGEVVVLTNVDLEHTAVLGTTRAAIATEKAGILKPGSIVVTPLRPDPERPPEDAPGTVVVARAAALGCALRTVDLGGTVTERNLALAGAALDALAERGEPTRAGLLTPEVASAARLPGRLERFDLPPPVVLDGAHVPSSAAAVLAELARAPDLTGPVHAVLSLARDKDVEGFLKALGARVDSFVCTSVTSGIHHEADALAGRARALGLVAEPVADPREALDRAVARAGPAGWVLVSGSLYLAGAVRAHLVGATQNPQATRCSSPTSS